MRTKRTDHFLKTAPHGVFRRKAVVALWLVLLFSASTPLLAQAWLPTRGRLDVGLSYTNVLYQYHYLPNGEIFDAGSTRTETYAFKFSYGLTDRLSLSGGLPYVVSWYEGGRPHPGDVDDGHKNEDFSDWRVGLHYQVSEGPVAFAPYVQYGSPATDYATLGHSATGRGLDELWLGFYAGMDVSRWIPHSYMQMRYNFAIVEEVVGIDNNRSNMDLELGFRLTPALTLRAVALFQDSYGGIDVPVPVSDPLFPYHDQLASEDFLMLGAGGSWGITESVTFYLLYLESIRGRNGHKVDQSISAGWTMTFDPHR